MYYTSRDGSTPAIDFLDDCPTKVAGYLLAVLDAVADAPPPRYSGGGKWEAMHGNMAGHYEVRATGPDREQFRLFCILENADEPELNRRGLDRPAIAVITGLRVADDVQCARLPGRSNARRGPQIELPAADRRVASRGATMREA